MMSINRSIDLTIYTIFHFSLVMNFFNSEDISVSIMYTERKTAVFVSHCGALFKYCFVSTFQYNSIKPHWAYSRGGGLS